MKYLPIRSYLVGALLALACSSAAWALEINTATVSDLTASGFSLTEAQRIVAYRDLNGPFLSSQDVLKVEGVNQGLLNKQRSTLTINGGPVTTPSGTAPAIPGVRPAIPAAHAPRVEINTATVSDLVRIGFSPLEAQRIVAFREQHGPFLNTRDVLKVEGVTARMLRAERKQLTINGTRITTRLGPKAAAHHTKTQHSTKAKAVGHSDAGVGHGRGNGHGGGHGGGGGNGGGHSK